MRSKVTQVYQHQENASLFFSLEFENSELSQGIINKVFVLKHFLSLQNPARKQCLLIK